MRKVQNIKEQVSVLVGSKVCITTRENRGRSDAFNGVLTHTYPAFFSIKTDGINPQTVTFNYTDILTEDITLQAT